MSKNTERGIGLQGGPADGQTADPAAGSGAAPKVAAPGGPVGEAARSDRAAEAPHPAAASDSRPVTLMGVPSPLSEREKVTALGRDVHLPAESHRMATSRPIAVAEVAPGPQTARGSGAPAPGGAADRPAPEATRGAAVRPKLSEAETMPALPAPSVVTPSPPVSATAMTIEASPHRPTNPADRATYDASPLVVSDEPSDETPLASSDKRGASAGRGPSIGLGIGLALVLSVAVVSVVRYETLEEVEDEPVSEENGATKAPGSPSKTPAEQPPPKPAAEPTKASATGGAENETAEATKQAAAPEPSPNPGTPEMGPDKDQPATDDVAPSPPGWAKDPRRGATTGRSRGAPPGRRASGEPESATGGTGNAPTAGPSTSPAKPPGSTPGTGQPYDPDSPLPPAGE